MNRADAVTYLARAWPTTATALGIVAIDNDANWRGAVDAALRAMGVARADLDSTTVATASEADFEALLDYHGARRLYEAAIHWVDVSVSDVGLSKRYSQMRDGLKELISQYEFALPDAYRVGGMVVYAQQATRDPDPYAVEAIV